jgi:anaerobic dimethyl sulfoxide reductase subunit B
MTTQHCFIYDESRCIRCRTCEAACKTVRGVEAGLFWRRLTDTWEGDFPDVKRSFLSLACLHCAEPTCLQACPTGAITRNSNGIVLVDRDKCNGCGDCIEACPYDIPQLGSDGKMQKCDFCRGAAEEPVCAVHCPTGALRFGDVETLPEPPAGKSIERYPGPNEPSLYIIRKSGTR